LFRAAATAPPPSPPPNQDWLDGHLATPQGGVDAGMGLPARQRRILFRARQRGWLELDVLLGRWAAKHVAELRDEVAVARVEALLEAETPHLYEWIVGISEPPPPYTDCEALRSLQEFAGGHGVVGRR
jgi:antitoxin CptB